MSITSKIRNFVRREKKLARKRYIGRMGFLAQGFIPASSQTVHRGERKYMRLRDPQKSRRGMDGHMR